MKKSDRLFDKGKKGKDRVAEIHREEEKLKSLKVELTFLWYMPGGVPASLGVTDLVTGKS